MNLLELYEERIVLIFPSVIGSQPVARLLDHRLFIAGCVIGATMGVLEYSAPAQAQFRYELPQINLVPDSGDSPGALVGPNSTRRDPWSVVRPPDPNPPPPKKDALPQKVLTPFELCTRAPSAEEAIRSCTEVASDEGETAARRANAYLVRSRAFEVQGQTIAAIADLTAILELTPSSAPVLRRRGQLWMGEQHYEQAIKDYTAAIAAAPKASLEVMIARGVAYRGRKDYKRALADFDRVIAAKAKSTTALAYYERALTKAGMQDQAGAMSDLQTALQHNPKLALAYYAIGNILFEQRDPAGALKSYDQAMQADASIEYYVSNARGIAQQQQGDCRSAIESFSKALSLNSKSFVILRNRANCLLRVGRYDEAIVDFTQALYATPDNPDLFAERASAFLQKHDHVTALRDISQAIKRDQNHPTALRNSARLKALRKDLIGALADFETAEIASPSPEGSSERVWLFIAAGDVARAQSEIDTALARSPKTPDALFARGYLHLMAGDTENARRDMSAAAQIDPEIRNRISYLDLKL
jgi:tetratricopeptide (TPR) repeat protein